MKQYRLCHSTGIVALKTVSPLASAPCTCPGSKSGKMHAFIARNCPMLSVEQVQAEKNKREGNNAEDS